jgi:hypothetical protein
VPELLHVFGSKIVRGIFFVIKMLYRDSADRPSGAGSVRPLSNTRENKKRFCIFFPLGLAYTFYLIADSLRTSCAPIIRNFKSVKIRLRMALIEIL